MPVNLRSCARIVQTVGVLLFSLSQSSAAQYPLAPTPVLPLALFDTHPTLTGYLSVRAISRDDTLTFLVNRARLTVQVLPIRFAALRVQADFAAIGRSRGDTVPAILLTDAYLELVAPDSSSRVVRWLRPALVVGQFRTPFSLEYLTPFSLLVTANRSQPVDRLSTRRDIGVLGQLRFTRYATLTGAIVNGEGANQTSNPNGRQMAVGRLTFFPMPSLAVSGKWLGQGGDHRWGYDVRWSSSRLIVEGEVIAKDSATGSIAAFDGRGGYALAAYRVRTWLQPVVKWERVREKSGAESGPNERRLTWTTYGVNVSAPEDRVRLQLDWVTRSERPVPASDELVAQLLVIF